MSLHGLNNVNPGNKSTCWSTVVQLHLELSLAQLRQQTFTALEPEAVSAEDVFALRAEAYRCSDTVAESNRDH